MAVIPVTDCTRPGLPVELTPLTDPGVEDTTCFNDGFVFLLLRNAGASSRTVTLPTTAVGVDGNALSDRTVSIPAGATRAVGALTPGYYNAEVSDPTLTIRGPVSDFGDVSVAALRLRP